MSDSAILIFLLQLTLGIVALGFSVLLTVFTVLMARIIYRDWSDL